MSYTISNAQLKEAVSRVRTGSANYELEWADIMRARAAGIKEGK